MQIPTYATCSMCEEWIEDKRDWTRGTCLYADANAKEGMTQAGITPIMVKVTLAWNAKPCSEWEPTADAQQDIARHAAEATAIAKSERAA